MAFDLNVLHTKDNNVDLRDLVNTAVTLGYDTIAVNHVVHGRLAASDTNSIQFVDLKGSSAGSATSSQQSTAARLESSGKALTQMSRVTLTVEDASQLQPLLASSNNILNSYDIVAVTPSGNEGMLLRCCQLDNVDIIALDLAHRISFPIKTTVVSQAIDKGIYFEVNMAPALRDAVARRHLIQNVAHLLKVTKGRNIVFSSGASSFWLLRAPHDIVNLGCMLGIEPAIAKKCITENPRAVVYHALTRKTAKGVLQAQPIALLSPLDKWKLPSDSDQKLAHAAEESLTSGPVALSIASSGTDNDAMAVDDDASIRQRRLDLKKGSKLAAQK